MSAGICVNKIFGEEKSSCRCRYMLRPVRCRLIFEKLFFNCRDVILGVTFCTKRSAVCFGASNGTIKGFKGQ